MGRVWGTWDIDDDLKNGLGSEASSHMPSSLVYSYFGVFITISLFLAPVKTFLRVHKVHIPKGGGCITFCGLGAQHN